MPAWTLAQNYDTSDIVLWSLLLIGLIVAGWLTVWQVKRRLQQTDDVLGNAGFTLSDLRRLHKSGQMSDDEFEKAKARVVDSARRAAARDEAKRQGAGAGGAGAAPTLIDPTPRPKRGPEEPPSTPTAM